MQFHPFPRSITEASAAAASRNQAGRGLAIGESRVSVLAAFRMPCGTVRPVYDPYRPSYPSGATPGTATFRTRRTFYANATAGHETSGGADFAPIDRQSVARLSGAAG